MADVIVSVPNGVLILSGKIPTAFVAGSGLTTTVTVPNGVLTLTGFAPKTIPEVSPIISDSFDFSDSSSGVIVTAKVLADTFRSDDNPIVGWKMIINEALNYSELQIIDWIITVVDQLFANDPLIVNGQYQGILTDLMDMMEEIEAWKVFNDILAENFNLSDSLIDFHRKVAIILDVLRLNETIVNTGTFQAFLSDSLNLKETLDRIFKELLGDTFSVSEVITENGIFLTAVSEDFTASDIVAEIFTATTKIVETFQGTDSAGVQGTFFILNNDEVLFQSEIVVSGQVFACWVLTTKDYRPSIYSNFDFNSYARLDNKLYGARDDGIYLLEGADDAGDKVHTGALFDFANMDIPETKRMRSIHLGSKTTEATIQVATDRGITRTYKTTNQRSVIGKEVRGKYWTVAVEDVENLKSMELNVVLLSKSR